jgi:magnesium transporter
MTTLFRIMDIPAAGGSASLSDGPDSALPPPDGIVRWIDVAAQDEPGMTLLAGRFGLHPLTVEDCLHFDQRPKLEEYGDYLFVVMHAFNQKPGDEVGLEPLELHAFLGRGYLMTVHEQPIAPLDTTWRRVAKDVALGRHGADFLLYLVADAIVDANFPVIDALSDRLEDLEDSVLSRFDRQDLSRIFELKHALVLMRRILSPERDVFAILAKRGDARISEKTALYFRDVYDHLARLQESIDAGRDILGNALDAYLSMGSNRTNEIMKRLTLLSAVFLPLTFVTGFFGQNFEHLPYHSDLFMFSMITLCVLMPSTMLLWFKRSGWF